MKVALSAIGKFHTFDLARQLFSRGVLRAIFTGYPRYKLAGENLPPELMRTYPWIHSPYMALGTRAKLGPGLTQLWEYLDRVAFDRHVSKNLPDCDVFVGLSSSALRTGKVARSRGAKYICDRGSSHIRSQDRLLREEHYLWNSKYAGVDPRIIEIEEAEYETSDGITVPSTFNVRTFLENGIPPRKVYKIPYGVDLARFHPTATPVGGQFNVLFVGHIGLRKGIPYLLNAFRKLRHPRKSLSLAGVPDADFIALMKRLSIWPSEVNVLGHIPQQLLKDIMSKSHVLVLPSIEEGLALVQAQAMACGCPVIGTDHTGAEDLFEDGKEGFIVGIRESDAIADKLQQLADDPMLRKKMSLAAVERVKLIGGWNEYGNQAFNLYDSLAT